MGLRVPEDIAIVGFDDLPFAEHMDPPLTTVRQPLAEEGRAAVRLLMDKIEGRLACERQEVLPCQLVVRRSCGAKGEPMKSTPRIRKTADQVAATR